MGKEMEVDDTVLAEWGVDLPNLEPVKVYNDCSCPLVVNVEKDCDRDCGGSGSPQFKKQQCLSLSREHLPLIINTNTIPLKDGRDSFHQITTRSVKSTVPNVKKGWKRFLGIFLAVLGSLCFSLAIVIVKHLSNFHAFSFGVWRFIGILLPSIPILIIEKFRAESTGKKILGSIWPLTKASNRKTFALLFVRCICGGSAIVLHYYSLNYMDLADSTVIVFSTPCFVTLFAWFILGEPCGILPVISAMLSLLGVIVVCRPPIFHGETFHRDLLIGIGLSFSSMLCATAVFIVLRSLRKVHVGLITCCFGLIGTVQCTILCGIIQRFDIPSSTWEWFLILSVCILSFLGQTGLTCALKYEQAGVVSLLRSLDVIFAFIWQYIFLDVRPDLYSFVGGSLVLFSVFLIGIRKVMVGMDQQHPFRKTFWFLLK